MTINRDKDKILYGECDECGHCEDTGETNFGTAVQVLKKEGWEIDNILGEFFHYCPDHANRALAQKHFGKPKNGNGKIT